MKLGTVVHTITSDSDSWCDYATQEWEATEVVNGGYEGAKEVISETVLKNHPDLFVKGAVVETWHEQTGTRIWKGKLRDDAVRNEGRVELAIKGDGERFKNRAGRLLYQTDDLTEWGAIDQGGPGFKSYGASVADGDGDYIQVPRDKRLPDNTNAVGSVAWLNDNYSFGVATRFYTPDVRLRRVAFDASIFGDATDSPTAVLIVRDYDITSSTTTTKYADAYVLTARGTSGVAEATFAVDIDLYNATYQDIAGRCEEIYLEVKDVSAGDPVLAAIYGAFPAFLPAAETNAYDGWFQPATIFIQNLRVNGRCSGDYFSVSSAVRDIGNLLGLRTDRVDDFAFNVLPLDFKDGESWAECLDYLAMFANARWRVLENGLEFGKWNDNLWHVKNENQVPDFLPLERFDRATVTYKSANKKTHFEQTVVHDPPLETPNGYGRVHIKDGNFYSALGLTERLVDAVYPQRYGGSFQISECTSDEGETVSALLGAHAGDALVHDYKRGRIARRSMTIRGVSGEFETNFAPLDRLLERRSKRLQAA